MGPLKVLTVFVSPEQARDMESINQNAITKRRNDHAKRRRNRATFTRTWNRQRNGIKRS
jgi:hypothetical protein